MPAAPQPPPMTGLFIIAHAPLASALREAALHTFPEAALDVIVATALRRWMCNPTPHQKTALRRRAACCSKWARIPRWC